MEQGADDAIFLRVLKRIVLPVQRELYGKPSERSTQNFATHMRVQMYMYVYVYVFEYLRELWRSTRNRNVL
jgi:hypothetical protein